MSSFMIQSLLESQHLKTRPAPDDHIVSSAHEQPTLSDVFIKTKQDDPEEENVTTTEDLSPSTTCRSLLNSPDNTFTSPSNTFTSPSNTSPSNTFTSPTNSVGSPNATSPTGSTCAEQKPAHSYVAIIAMAILESACKKLVLSDIYKYILEKYPYFQNKGQGWRNSVRHNLSLNQCFAKAGRAENGKGNYWTIHPANMEDFKKGDFRRRLTRRSRRKYFSVNELSQLNPLLSPVSLIKHENPGTDELLSALFKYNLSNLASTQNSVLLSNITTLTSSPNNLNSLPPNGISSTVCNLSSTNLPSLSPNNLSSLSPNNLSALSSGNLSISQSSVPNLSISSAGASTCTVTSCPSTQLLPNPPPLQLPARMSSLFNHESSSLLTKPDTRDQYLPTLLSKKLYTATTPHLYPTITPHPAPCTTKQLLSEALTTLNIPLPTLSANASILKSHLLASYNMQQWLSYCEQALNSKGL